MNPLHPNRMTSDERLAEVASILARGVLRLRLKSSGISAHRGESSLDSSPDRSGHAPVATGRRAR